MNFPKILLAAAALALAAGCTQTASAPQPTMVEDTIEATATVTSLDILNRRIGLETEDGRRMTIVAGPEVRNLAQIDIGDKVKAMYIQGVAARLAAPGASGTQMSAAAARAPEGTKPGAMVGETVRTVVTIVSYDDKSKLVTFAGDDGLVRSVVVKKPEMQEFARGLKAGDKVEVTFTEAFAIGVIETGY
jgi:hypothetical protein